MKSKSLFGVQFAQDIALKIEVLKNFQSWKSKTFDQAVREGKFTQSLLDNEPNIVKNAKGEYTLDFSLTAKLLDEHNCRHYLITKPVLEMCDKIRVKEPFELHWLMQIPDGKRQLNFGNKFIRYHKENNVIRALAMENTALDDGRSYWAYSFFSFDLADQQITGHHVADDFDEKGPVSSQTFDATMKIQLYRLIIYMELADVEEVVVEPGRKFGTKKSAEQLLNEARFPITIVTTNWNKVIRTTGFDVRGFLRKQPCGPGNRERKLIWIDPYHKQGYNLNAKASNAKPREIRDDNNGKGLRR